MRCMVCGEEMRLVQTVPDDTMTVRGFEHHFLNCPGCHDEERRLVFIRQPAPLSPPIETHEISPPIETHEIDQDFLDATLQPIGETSAMDSISQDSSSVRSGETLPVESMALASPRYQSSMTRNARAAASSIWDRRAALHRARWRALCDRLGLRVAGQKPGASKEE
jgi:hypothetical protein